MAGQGVLLSAGVGQLDQSHCAVLLDQVRVALDGLEVFSGWMSEVDGVERDAFGVGGVDAGLAHTDYPGPTFGGALYLAVGSGRGLRVLDHGAEDHRGAHDAVLHEVAIDIPGLEQVPILHERGLLRGCDRRIGVTLCRSRLLVTLGQEVER